MLEQLEEKLGMELRGFKWVGSFSKANRRHFVEVYKWEGEIYIKGKGIFSCIDYYKALLNDGMCLLVDGVIVAKRGYSDHYNSLHKCHIGKLKELKFTKVEYPLKDLSMKGVFDSAVNLYKMGLLNAEQLEKRIKKYIKPEFQVQVLLKITNTNVA